MREATSLNSCAKDMIDKMMSEFFKVFTMTFAAPTFVSGKV